MEAKLDSLHLDLEKRQSSLGTRRTKKKKEVANSWEEDSDDGDDDGDGDGAPTDLKLRHVTSDDIKVGTQPPPPTPIHAVAGSNKYDWSSAGVLGGGRPQPVESTADDRKRPEKTTATAGRMIAASLGIKAPKKTDEQRQYDRAVREQEIKRKNREKEARQREEEEDEKAKAAVWEG